MIAENGAMCLVARVNTARFCAGSRIAQQGLQAGVFVVWWDMSLFALLLFPCAFVYYAAGRFEFVRPRLLTVLSALILAGLVCVFRGFFLFRTPYDGASVAFFFLKDAVSCVAVPCVAYAVFMLAVRGAWETKLASFALFMLPFYAVYLPAEMLASPAPLPFFALFVKPVLYLLAVVAAAHELRVFAEAYAQKGIVRVVPIVLLVFEMAFPALLETLWYYAFPLAVQGFDFFIYVAVVAVRTACLSRVMRFVSRQK